MNGLKPRVLHSHSGQEAWLTLSAREDAGELHCFSRENWRRALDYRRVEVEFQSSQSIWAQRSSLFLPLSSVSLRTALCHFGYVMGNKDEKLGCSWVHSRHAGFILHVHMPREGRLTRSQNKIGFNKARITHNALVNSHWTLPEPELVAEYKSKHRAAN